MTRDAAGDPPRQAWPPRAYLVYTVPAGPLAALRDYADHYALMCLTRRQPDDARPRPSARTHAERTTRGLILVAVRAASRGVRGFAALTRTQMEHARSGQVANQCHRPHQF